jgi:hypothetical protein
MRRPPLDSFIGCTYHQTEEGRYLGQPPPTASIASRIRRHGLSPRRSLKRFARLSHLALHRRNCLSPRCYGIDAVTDYQRNNDAVRAQNVVDVRAIGVAFTSANNWGPGSSSAATAYTAHSRHTVLCSPGREAIRLNSLRVQAPGAPRHCKVRYTGRAA